MILCIQINSNFIEYHFHQLIQIPAIKQNTNIGINTVEMKQMSLLDSFIKKAENKKNGQQDTKSTTQEKITQKQAINSSAYKQTIQKENITTNKVQVDQDSEKKNGKVKKSNAKSTAKSQKSKSKTKMNIQSDDEEFQAQSEKQSASVDDDDFQSQSEESQQQYKAKKIPKKSQRKKGAVSEISVKKIEIKESNSDVIAQQTNPFDRSQFTEVTPQWAIPGHPKCLDKQGRNSSDPNYDQTTLQIPPGALNDVTASVKQYWKIKSQNFDKVILFKLGKFYQLLFEDALVGNKLLDLKWMGTKMHAGFPQKSLERYTTELIRLGLKVVVVEQMQTPDQMQSRVKEDKAQGRKSQKTLKRQITQICTKGTQVPKEQDETYLPNYLISVYRHNELIAYSLLDVGANSVMMGIVDSFEEFKTILYQTRPSQFLYDPDNLPLKYIEVFKENLNQMVLSKLPNKDNIWHYLGATNQLEQLASKQILAKPKIMETLEEFQFIPKTLMISTISGMFDYLHKIYKFQYVIPSLRFRFYEKQKVLNHLILDSQALQHLQIFQTTEGQKGSLFDKVERTKTKFGKRLFRKWMVSPLLSPYKINQRLDAVEDIRKLASERLDIMKQLAKLPDLQRVANKLQKYAIKNTSASEAIYFQDLSTLRLKQFNTFMISLEKSLIIIAKLEKHKQNFKSRRLKALITPCKKQDIDQQKLIYFQDQEFDEENSAQIKGLLPDILTNLGMFKQFIVWKNDKPYPKPGLIQNYDILEQQKKQIQQQLTMELQKLRKKFNCPQINYTHVKQRYQVQIPQKKQIKVPKQYCFSSKRAGYSRYLVSQIREIVQKLDQVEKTLKIQMVMFVRFFFQNFKEKQNIWERYTNILAEIDCLTGMAQYYSQISGCRPKFVQSGYEAQQAYHPSLYTLDFVPNDISFEKPIVILTGPNMGGKSTILRATCQLTILAQMGSFVPAKKYEAAIIDRIFTRIGASDKLQAGKSTFFIEMEQTKSIMSSATSRSLAIIDELGRGTATFDGMAIAHSVLNYLVNKIGCKCMFATHYHSLTDQFSHMQETCLKMMDYKLIEGQQDRIKFLYKLIEGKAQKSFGLNVAQMVGLPLQVVTEARKMSDKMHLQIEQKRVKARVLELAKSVKNEQTYREIFSNGKNKI